ncbi:MAG: ABC transporter ATP-binding protein [Culicoidibacterales bacterium]
MKLLLSYLAPFKKELKYGPFFKWLEAVFELIIPFIMIKIIDVGIGGKDKSYLLSMGAIMLLLGSLGLVCSLICQYYASRASQGYGTIVRNKLFSHIHKLSHQQINEIGASSLETRLTNDINQLQLAVAMLIRLVVRAPFLVLGAMVMSMFINWQLALIFVAIIPLIAAVIYLIMRQTIPKYKLIQAKIDQIGKRAHQQLTGARVIRSSTRLSDEKRAFKADADQITERAINVGYINALLNPLTTIIINIGIITIIWFGGIKVAAGVMTQGEVIAFISYMTQILLALIIVASLIILFTKAYASAKRIAEILELQPQILEKKAPAQTILRRRDCPQIQCINVCFSYSDDATPLLSNLNFSINSGQKIGIIGGTGAGKSTLIRLLPRLQDVSLGSILFYGVDVRGYQFDVLRKNIMIVPQKAIVFSGTVAHNLRVGNLLATDEQMWHALKIAQADEFVRADSLGLEKIILEDGANLSGGQKQRLTIARSLMSQPEILIFDDSTSALDYVTDAKLRQNLAKHCASMTIIAVSQRIAAIAHSDLIIVLEHGKIVGQGTHQQLLVNCAAYQEIARSQLGDIEVKQG